MRFSALNVMGVFWNGLLLRILTSYFSLVFQIFKKILKTEL